VTIIKCEECDTEFINEEFGLHNSCDLCECKNLQIIVLPTSPDSKIKSLMTVRYKRVYPLIFEIEEEKKENKKEKPEKGMGFK
jgi:hypothetical protein